MGETVAIEATQCAGGNDTLLLFTIVGLLVLLLYTEIARLLPDSNA